MAIRPLTAANAAAYRELRLRALRDHPSAFAASYEQERERPLAELERSLEHGAERRTLGAFDDGRLVAIASLVRHTRPKQRHRALVTAMFVTPEARGRGLGRTLLDHLLSVAREWGVSDVSLAVTMGNDEARRLYASAGFLSCAVEPNALRVEDRFHDVEWMYLRLPAADAGASPP